MFNAKLPYLPPYLSEMTEFLSTHVLPLLRPNYRFYRGNNPLAKALFTAVQAILKAMFRMRWKVKYFRHPIEMWLIRRLLSKE